MPPTVPLTAVNTKATKHGDYFKTVPTRMFSWFLYALTLCTLTVTAGRLTQVPGPASGNTIFGFFEIYFA